MASHISLIFIAVCSLMVCCTAVPMQKRDAEKQTTASDLNQQIDKFMEDLGKNFKQLATDGVNITDIFNTVSSKIGEYGTQLQTYGTELGNKLQETAKQQGLTT